MEVDIKFIRRVSPSNDIHYSYCFEVYPVAKHTGPIRIYTTGHCVWYYRTEDRVIKKYIDANGTIEIHYNDSSNSVDIIFPYGVKEMYMDNKLVDTQNMVDLS